MTKIRLRTTAGLTLKPSEVSAKDRSLPPGMDHLWNRPYQPETLFAMRELIARGPALRDPHGKPLLDSQRSLPRILVAGPTGCGKGTMIPAAVAMFLNANARATVAIAAPRYEIATDLQKRLGELGIRADLNFHGRYAIQVGTIQALVARSGTIRVPDVLILDEGHHMRANTWESVIGHCARAQLIGFTATTIRADGSQLGDLYDVLLESCNYSDLLALGGILVECDLYRPEYYLGPHLTMAPLDAYRLFARGPTLVFERSAERARQTMRDFMNAGIKSAVVLEDTGRAERKTLLKEFEDGRRPVLISVDVLTEGIDLVNATTIILGKPFSHLSPYKQCVGRALRFNERQPDKRALVIDLTGTTHLLKRDMPTDDYPYELSITQKTVFSGGHGDGFERGDDQDPQVLDLPMFDARTREVVRPASAERSVEHDYIQELKLLVRAKEISAEMAKQRYRFEFGVCPRWVDFR